MKLRDLFEVSKLELFLDQEKARERYIELAKERGKPEFINIEIPDNGPAVLCREGSCLLMLAKRLYRDKLDAITISQRLGDGDLDRVEVIGVNAEWRYGGDAFDPESYPDTEEGYERAIASLKAHHRIQQDV